MNGLIISAMLMASTAAVNSTDYKSAFKQADTTGRPLVVLIGAEWCPGCLVMKNQTIPSLQKDGRLDGVAFTMIDYDKDNTLARKLMREESIPQLLVFRKTDDGWKRSQMIGAQDPDDVHNFISKAVNQQKVAKKAVAGKPVVGPNKG